MQTLTLEGMSRYDREAILRETSFFLERTALMPGMLDAIRAKAAQLRAEGFFDRFPAPVQEGDLLHET